MSTVISQRQQLATGVAIKVPCAAATNTNCNLSGAQTVGGVAVAVTNPPTRVLCFGQTDALENGIYDVQTGAWTRSIDSNGIGDFVQGTIGIVSRGTYADQWWVMISPSGSSGWVIPGTDMMVFHIGVPPLSIQELPPSIKDFGALGDPYNDNAAFVLAEASTALQIYIPAGNWICQDSGTLTKAYIGPGTITGIASVIVPGNYEKRSTALSPIPQQGGGNYWAGDTSHSRQRYSVLGNIKSGLTFPYYCAQETPWFEIFDNYAGASGIIAIVDSPITAGDLTARVNSVAGFSVGQVVGILNPTTGAVDQTLTIGSIGTSPNALGFGGTAITNSYAVGTRITDTLRTMTPSHHYELTHYGAGDAYILSMRMTAAYTPLAGQSHFYYTSTTGFGGGDIGAAHNGNYLTGWEFQFIDNGYDTAAIGDIRSYDRTNNTSAIKQVWIDKFTQSYGSQPIDAGYVLAGKANCGVDLSACDFSANGNNAIGLGVNHRIYWGNTKSATPAGLPDPLWGDTNSTNWDDWTGSSRRFVVGNNPTLTLSSTAAQFVGYVETTGYYGVDGTQVVSNQITGYGIPTGGVRASNFAGGTATLAETSAQLAQVILDLKTHGLLGA